MASGDEEYVMTTAEWENSWSSGHDSTFIAVPHPLADKGHQVTGLECSQVAILKFFKTNNIEFTQEPVEALDGKLYKSVDGSIRIYQCDLYKFNADVAGTFDCIWDSGSLEAINHKDRLSYAKILTSLMGNGCKYFIHSFSYDKNKVEFGPYMFSTEDVGRIFGDQCHVELLSQYKMPENFLTAYNFPVDSNCYGILHLLTLK